MSYTTIIVCVFSIFLGLCFGIIYALLTDLTKKNAWINKILIMLCTDIGTTVFSFMKIFDFLSNNQKLIFNILLYIVTLFAFVITILARKVNMLIVENKQLKKEDNNKIFVDVCEEKIAVSQNLMDEFAEMTIKVAEFENDIEENSNCDFNIGKDTESFIGDICSAIIHKFFNNSDVQVYVKDMSNNIVIDRINNNKIKIETKIMNYDFAKLLLNFGVPEIGTFNCGKRLKNLLKNNKEVYIIPIVIAEEPTWYIFIYVNNRSKFLNTILALNLMKIEEKISKHVDVYQLNKRMKELNEVNYNCNNEVYNTK